MIGDFEMESSEEALETIGTRTENPMITRAIDAIHRLNADEILREQIRVQEKAALDYGNDMAVARDEGFAEGFAEGRAEGFAEGRAETCSDFVEALRRTGMSEDQIKIILDDLPKEG